MLIEMTLRGVLLAGKWRTEGELNSMSTEDQRNTLIVELSQHTNQPGGYFQGFDNDTLVGKGAVVVFLRESGIRDVNTLKTMSDDDQRNTLIVVNHSRTGKSGAELQGLSNQDLVRIGLGEPIGSRAPNAFAQEILDAHNRYRAEVGVPPLQWSDSLAADAQPWANYLTSLGGIQLIHSNTPGQGESLFGGSPPGAFGLTRMVDDWGSEKSSFVAGPFTNVGFDGGVIGHYTQMIWRSTTHVGCAIANNGQDEFLVCRYSPQGNVIGQQVP
jgi:hypothetical protein